MIYDSKIIIVDVDFYKINKANADVRINMSNILQRISGDQNLLILTNENLYDANKKCVQLGIRSGYLISNAGAVIYNIASGKTMFEKKIHSDDVKVIVHIATLKDLLVVIHNKTRKKFSYKINSWCQKHLANEALNNNSEQVYVYDYWKKFISAINEFDINSIEILFQDNTPEIIKSTISDFASKISKLVQVDLFLVANTLYITPKNATRLNAVKKISQILKTDVTLNSLYVGASSFYSELVRFTYISATSREIVVNSNSFQKSKKPTVFLYSSVDSWIHWLTDNDYLWSHEPKNSIVTRLISNEEKTDTKALMQICSSGLKKFFLKSITDENIVAKPVQFPSKKQHTNLLMTKKTELISVQTQKNFSETNDNAWDTIVLWKENCDEIVQRINKDEKKVS